MDGLPEEWRTRRLADVVESGGNVRRPIISAAATIPFIPMSLLPQGALYAEKWEPRAPGDVRSGIPVQEGDLLLAKITPCLENGKQGIVKGLPNGWGYATTEVIPLRGTGILTEFLAFYLLVPRVRNWLASKMEGATGRQRLPRPVLEGLTVPAPPLHEQRAIARVLRTVQRAKEATERVIAAARELKQSLMRYLFTYGPVPVGEADRVPLKETEIGPVPGHWRLGQLGELVDVAHGQVDPGVEPYRSQLHVGPENIEEATGRLLNLRSNKDIGIKSGNYAFTKEDVLYSKIRPYLRKVALPFSEGTCSADMYPLRPKDQRVSREFLFHLLLTDAFSLQATAHQARTGIPKINRVQLATLVIPVPPLTEQHNIAHILSIIDRKVDAERHRQQALEALFRNLLENLMTGKVRVNDLETPRERQADAAG